MTELFTTKLGLVKPQPGTSEPVDISKINSNMDKVDQWAGAILVNDGVVPSTAELFDGAIVKEKLSGKVWVAQKNGGGTFDQRLIQYPYTHCALNATDSMGSVASYTFRDPLTFSAAWTVNGLEAHSGSGGFIVPVAGIWSIHSQIRWGTNATGNRGALYAINGISQNNETEEMRPAMSGYETILDISMCRPFAQGDAIRTMLFQNSGTALNAYQVRTATLVSVF